MKRGMMKILLLALIVCFSTSSVLHAEIKEGMSQGDFALALVKAIGALAKLPSGANGQDAIDFLIRLNVQPKEGWKKDAVITKQFLASLLGDDSAASLDFDSLIMRVRDDVLGRFNDQNLGVFRAYSSSASGSTTI